MFSFYPKNGRPGSRKTSITKVWLFVESWPTPHWLTFLTFYRLVYDIPCHLNGLILAWRTSLQLFWKVSHQNSKLLYEVFPFLKQVVRVIQLLLCYYWVIFVELKRKVEYSLAYTFWVSLCFKGYRSLPWTWDGVKYYKLSIATGVTSNSIFQLFEKIFNMCLFDSQSMHNWQ